jgi:hypothetical protein
MEKYRKFGIKAARERAKSWHNNTFIMKGGRNGKEILE